MKHRAPILTTSALFIAVVGIYLLLAVRYPMGYIWATYEDLFGEWLQFWCFVATLVLSLKLAFTRGTYRAFFALLALGSLYVALEEISWGQRVLGFSSPEFFKANNLQGETNLHNMLTGPYTTTLKDTLTYLVSAGLVVYGLVYPATLRLRWRPSIWLDRCGLASPPLYLWPFFTTAAYLELGVLKFNEAEIAEVLVGISLVITSLFYLFSQGRGLDARETNTWPSGSSAALSMRIGGSCLGVLVLSAITTGLVYAQPAARTRIDRRIANGVEKFAGRYAKHEQWDTAASLYEQVHEAKPRSRSTLRKLADCYDHLGDIKKRDTCLEHALAIDLGKLKKDPGAASASRSLVRTYRTMGNHKEANTHLKKALRICLSRVEKYPNSANAAYSLGRTYELQGDLKSAFEQFQRACELEPTSKKFRKAYYRTRRAQTS